MAINGDTNNVKFHNFEYNSRSYNMPTCRHKKGHCNKKNIDTIFFLHLPIQMHEINMEALGFAQYLHQVNILQIEP